MQSLVQASYCAEAAAMGIVFTAVEWWLGFLRWTVLVVLSPLIVPFLLITWLARILGKSAVATLLALIAAPFTFGWWAAKTGEAFGAHRAF